MWQISGCEARFQHTSTIWLEMGLLQLLEAWGESDCGALGLGDVQRVNEFLGKLWEAHVKGGANIA